MPKRAKTPELGDSARYFAVYQAYPLHANWELSEDYIPFILWISCCVPPEYVLALHYKPRSGSTVLLEVSKDFEAHGQLIGEHKWVEFLKTPSDEEKVRSTQIYYSVYSTLRAAQKDGWKAIHVEEIWFKDWNSFKRNIIEPYPTPVWCPLPPQDATNKLICREIPPSVKPSPIIPVVPPTVGSPAWVMNRAQSGSEPPPSSVPNNNRGRGRGNNRGNNRGNDNRGRGLGGNGRGSQPTRGVTTNNNPWASTPPWSPTATSPANSLWNQPITSTSPTIPTSPQLNAGNNNSNGSSEYSPGSNPRSPISTQTIIPPGPRPVRPANASAASSALAQHARPANPIGSSQNALLQREFSMLEITDEMKNDMFGLDDELDDVQQDEMEWAYVPQWAAPTQSSSATQTTATQAGKGKGKGKGNANGGGNGSGNGKASTGAGAKGKGQQDGPVQAEQQEEEEEPEDYWADQPVVVVRGKKPPELLCPTHGIICKVGICLDYAKVKRAADQAKKKAEKAQRDKDRKEMEKKAKDLAKAKEEARAKGEIVDDDDDDDDESDDDDDSVDGSSGNWRSSRNSAASSHGDLENAEKNSDLRKANSSPTSARSSSKNHDPWGLGSGGGDSGGDSDSGSSTLTVQGVDNAVYLAPDDADDGNQGKVGDKVKTKTAAPDESQAKAKSKRNRRGKSGKGAASAGATANVGENTSDVAKKAGGGKVAEASINGESSGGTKKADPKVQVQGSEGAKAPVAQVEQRPSAVVAGGSKASQNGKGRGTATEKTGAPQGTNNQASAMKKDGGGNSVTPAVQPTGGQPNATKQAGQGGASGRRKQSKGATLDAQGQGQGKTLGSKDTQSGAIKSPPVKNNKNLSPTNATPTSPTRNTDSGQRNASSSTATPNTSANTNKNGASAVKTPTANSNTRQKNAPTASTANKGSNNNKAPPNTQAQSKTAEPLVPKNGNPPRKSWDEYSEDGDWMETMSVF